ncbi:MAG: hypothetical protein JSR66_04255 [Proteobacteria bacterium]|nr:hypothetical protein [Pseudomonadota bacterium]
MNRLLAIALACLVITSTAAFGKDKAPFSLPKGTQVAVVNLLDPEIMHYHAGKKSIDSYVKVQPVNWNVDEMLMAALRAQPVSADLTLTPVAPTDALLRSRESCFVSAPLVKGLPKNCAAPLVGLAKDANVSYLIVMAPGLNNSAHADSNRLDISEMLRGWGIVTHEFAGTKDKPSLFCEVEMLLIGITPEGAAIRVREWGGSYNYQWAAYTVPADPKLFPPEQLDQLQPLFREIVQNQAKQFMDQVHIGS